jgi:energy-coupling factor transporter ATP-binding protein EcfA2
MSKVIRLESSITRTPRVMQLEGLFDIDSEKNSVTEIPINIPNLDERDWNIGLIVGPSGAGKTTIAREMFPEKLRNTENMVWSKDKAIIDDFPIDMPMREVTQLLSSVGFSSPKAWLRPFHALSNGEQFRVTMARVLAENNGLSVVDEFTSVIDRTVAQIGSHAIASTIRKRKQKFVAVGCHYDIEEWLQPDWIYQPHTGEFTWRSVQPRPRVEVEIIWAKYDAWHTFSRHHYLDAHLNKAAYVYVGLINNQPACLAAVLPMPHAKVRNGRRFSRNVVLPDFQGIGLGRYFLDAIAAGLKAQDLVVYATASHPAQVHNFNKSSNWEVIRVPSRVAQQGKTSGLSARIGVSRARITSSFKYRGEPDTEIAKVLAPLPKK